MLCNKLFRIASNEGCAINLLMPSENLIVDIQNDLGTKETIEVNLSTTELLECAHFLTTGQIPKTNIDNFLRNIKYLQCVNIIPDVPDQFNLIKMKEDWLRHNIPNSLIHIDPYCGVYKLDAMLYENYPLCKLSVRKTLYAPKTHSNPIDINNCKAVISNLLLTININNTREKGVLVAGGSVFCSLFKQRISDYDLFFYGYTEDQALALINWVISSPFVTNVTRTAYAITFQWANIWRTDIQFILRLYQSIPQILLGFDLDCSRIGSPNRVSFHSRIRLILSILIEWVDHMNIDWQNIPNAILLSMFHNWMLLKFDLKISPRSKTRIDIVTMIECYPIKPFLSN